MVSYESLEHNLSNRYKIYALYNSHNFAVVEIVPLTPSKIEENGIFLSQSVN